MPGYGWIFPLGDGRVNVGVGLLSTDQRWKGVNTSTLMDHFVAWAPTEWELSPATCLGPPTGGKLPMGLAVGPRVGRHHPGGGGRRRVDQPLQRRRDRLRLRDRPAGRRLAGRGAVRGRGGALDRYEARLEDAYGLYYRVARAFIRMISRPELMQLCVGTGMHSESLMGWILRIMANLLRPDETGPAEAAYRALALIARLAPEAPEPTTGPEPVDRPACDGLLVDGLGQPAPVTASKAGRRSRSGAPPARWSRAPAGSRCVPQEEGLAHDLAALAGMVKVVRYP